MGSGLPMGDESNSNVRKKKARCLDFGRVGGTLRKPSLHRPFCPDSHSKPLGKGACLAVSRLADAAEPLAARSPTAARLWDSPERGVFHAYAPILGAWHTTWNPRRFDKCCQKWTSCLPPPSPQLSTWHGLWRCSYRAKRACLVQWYLTPTESHEFP